MKKLIFRKFAKDTTSFFILMCLIVGLIVWTVQAVNYFDFVVQDGHGLRTYFFYIILNFLFIIEINFINTHKLPTCGHKRPEVISSY